MPVYVDCSTALGNMFCAYTCFADCHGYDRCKVWTMQVCYARPFDGDHPTWST